MLCILSIHETWAVLTIVNVCDTFILLSINFRIEKSWTCRGRWRHSSTAHCTFHRKMLGRICICELQSESFRYQNVDVGVVPVVSRKVLEENHETLKWYNIFSVMLSKQTCFVISPESHFPASTCPSTGVRMRHTHKAETQRNHLTRPDMCPTVELCSRAEARESTSCLAIGMKIADNQHRVIEDVYGVRLRKYVGWKFMRFAQLTC